MAFSRRDPAGPATGGTHRPGLVKAKRPPLWLSRTLTLARTSDARIAELFQDADVVSEGRVTGDDPERAYFGSTNIILRSDGTTPGTTRVESAARPSRSRRDVEPTPTSSVDEAPPRGESAALEIFSTDPHVRLRAMRMARREAALRAEGQLDRMRAEISIRKTERGIVVHVEVEAHVFPDRRVTSR